jgi:hypothetical protein
MHFHKVPKYGSSEAANSPADQQTIRDNPLLKKSMFWDFAPGD